MTGAAASVDYNGIVLRDGILVGLAGAALVFFSGPLAPVLGWPPESGIRVLGLVLALYGAGLARQARSMPQDRRLPKSAAVVNLLFAAACPLVPLLAGAPMTAAGWAAAALFALVAAGFAVAQLRVASR
ncbi:MAG: hypothetical protein ACKOWF_11865 [Chloroflexota bacterium]